MRLSGAAVAGCEEGGDLPILGRVDGGGLSGGCVLPDPWGSVSGRPSLSCLFLSCGSDPVHELLCPLSGEFPVVTLPSLWVVPGRMWGDAQGPLTEQVIRGP